MSDSERIEAKRRQSASLKQANIKYREREELRQRYFAWIKEDPTRIAGQDQPSWWIDDEELSMTPAEYAEADRQGRYLIWLREYSSWAPWSFEEHFPDGV